MRFTIMFAGAALCVAAAVPAALFAQDSAWSPKDSTRHKIWAQLGLSPDQKAKLKDMRKQMMEFRRQSFDRMKALLDKSKEELLKPSASKAVLYGYAKEIGDLHKAMSERMADHMLAIKSILSKEQFEKLLSNEFRPPLRGGPREGGPRHGPHDGPPDFDE
jgi:Spy/CpxP family protein refolding chaperone